jgi:hypothetical protein
MNKKKILIIDKFSKKRDLSQSYVYEFLEKRFECTFKEQILRFTPSFFLRKFDLVYFGIYHFDIHEKSTGKFYLMDLNSFISKMKNKQVLVADQVDSEFFLKRNSGSKMVRYEKFEGRKFLFERYSSPELKKFGQEKGFSVKNLPWMIKKEDYGKFDPDKKDIDVCFVCTITPGYDYHRRRLNILNNLLSLKKTRPELNFYISAPPFYPENAVYGEEYKNILSRSKVFIVEGSDRSCLTQKYLEAGMSGCVLIGDRPKFPEKNIFVENDMMIETDPTDPDKLKHSINDVLGGYETHQADVRKCIDKIVRYHDPEIVMNDLLFSFFQKKDLK